MSNKEFDLSHYLSKIENHNKKDILEFVKSKGTVNDVDYYIECMKKEYPNYQYKKLYVSLRNYKPSNMG